MGITRRGGVTGHVAVVEHVSGWLDVPADGHLCANAKVVHQLCKQHAAM